MAEKLKRMLEITWQWKQEDWRIGGLEKSRYKYVEKYVKKTADQGVFSQGSTK
jgi:hypothetical protein